MFRKLPKRSKRDMVAEIKSQFKYYKGSYADLLAEVYLLEACLLNLAKYTNTIEDDYIECRAKYIHVFKLNKLKEFRTELYTVLAIFTVANAFIAQTYFSH